MIKVTHTKTLDGTIEQSQFPNLEAWEQHPYYNNPNFVNFVEDITTQVVKESALVTRQQEIIACNVVIQLVGLFNKSKPQGTVLTVLQTPQMQSIIFALLTGAPSTAKAAITALGVGLYTEIELNEVIAVLDSVI